MITGYVYYPHEHGTTGINMPVYQFSSWIYPYSESGSNWPYLRLDGRSIYFNGGGLFGIGSPVLLKPGKEGREDPQYMSFVMMDFDCPKSEQNFERVVSTLQGTFSNAPFYLFDSGNSYHLVVDTLVHPGNIPWHWGRLIREFAKTEPDETRGIFDSIGFNLQRNYKDGEAIKEISSWLLKEISHYDAPSGLHFILDLRWVAHSLMDFVNLTRPDKGSFGCLRVSKRGKDGQPPILIFKES